MKLELKHIVGYLPYELSFLNNENNFELTVNGTTDENKVFNHGNGYFDFENIKLVLRPLSDLTKEIEHNGEKFIPMERLLAEHLTIYTKHITVKSKHNVVEIFHENFKYVEKNNYNVKYVELGVDSIKQLTFDDSFMRFTLREINPLNSFLGMSYKRLGEMMLEYKFDIHGLIESGLAIDINTTK